MKKALLLSIAAVAMTAGLASAQGINLSLNDCGTSGTLNIGASCATNTGTIICVGSVFAPPAGVPHMVGMEAVIDAVTSAGILSPWWTLDGCRASAMSFSADFSANSNCTDYWQSQGTIVGGISPNHAAPNRFRIVMAAATPGEVPIDNTENYMFKVNIKKTLATGAGACAGCTDAATLVLNEIKLVEPAGVGDFRITNPANSQYVTYAGGVAGGPGVVATSNKTWGQVKALYR